MIVLRGNVILPFLGIYLILGFLTVFVFSEEEKWINKQQAFKYAGCMAQCYNNLSTPLLRKNFSDEWHKQVDVIFLLDYFSE